VTVKYSPRSGPEHQAHWPGFLARNPTRCFCFAMSHLNALSVSKEVSGSE
jgi:hypothetical protein